MSAGAGREHPLVILGIDAGDPGFLLRWAAEGYLPTLAGILERGAWGRTGGAELISEHGAWVSILSGVSRRDHGYFYFRQLVPGTYDLGTVTGRDVDAPPFWLQLDGGAGRLALLDIPDYDPVPGLDGVQLAHWATHSNWDPKHFVTASEPPEVLEEMTRRFAPRLVTVEEHDTTPENDARILARLLERVATKGAACRQVLDRGPFDLLVTVFAESHTANHQFWRYRPEIPDGERRPELEHAIRDVYRAIDREIGLLLERLPSTADVVVVSSVGMSDDFPTTGLIEAFCRGFGYQVAPVASAPGLGGPLDWGRRLVPERWRVALSRFLPRERREGLLADQFRRSTDWARTRAFAIPAAYTSFVRVNQRGREPAGIVAPGAETEALLDRIESDLASLVEPESGEPAVGRTIRTAAAFGEGAHAALPDLWVEWRPGRFLSRVVHPGGELTQERPDFYRRSDHSGQGFFAAAGPGILPHGEIGDVDVLDLAPTFLALLGAPPAARMRGRPLAALLA